MRFSEIYDRWTTKRLTQEEAAQLLGVCDRTFRRWLSRYEAEGAEGLADQRIGRKARNAAPVDEMSEMLTLFETRYPAYTASHFYDKYYGEYKGTRSYTWVKTSLQDAGLVKKAKKRGAHRRRREREAMKGLMVHQDGSTHEWVEGKVWDLIVTLDDADSEIYSAFFVDEEGTWSSFRGVKETILEHGLFCTFYSDRGSHYWYTPKVGGKVDKTRPTQFGRAMQQLGIEMIAAYSPEARGRSERMFRTLQGRLPKELKDANLTEMAAANEFLKTKFLPVFNKRFKIKPREDESAFVPWINANMNLDNVLCIQDSRTVNKDNTISYNNIILQIPKDRYRYSYQKAKVKVYEHEDHSMSLFYGPRCLGLYNSDGTLRDSSVTEDKVSAMG